MGPLGVWIGALITGARFNGGNLSDPYIDQTYLDIIAEPDPAKQNKMIKALPLYFLEQAYVINGPNAYFFTFWQPWLKNSEGESFMTYFGFGYSYAYNWVDQKLKKEMTGME